jgi:Sulfotransferase family
MPERPPFPFVVGSGRSGTTLLRLMLEQHPDLAIPPESYFPVSMRHREPRYRSSAGFDLDAFVTDLLGNVRFQDWGLSESTVRSALHGVEPIDWADAIRRTFALYAEKEGKPRYGDKTPWFIMRINELSELFPESRFVHLIRDGRDVALSLSEVSWGPGGVEESARKWVRDMGRARRRASRLRPGTYMEARYEDLVVDPEPIVRRVAEFVDLPWNDAMLAYHEGAEERMSEVIREFRPLGGGIITAEERVRQHELVAQPPSASRVGRWKAEMSPEQQEAFRSVAGKLLVQLGYEV